MAAADIFRIWRFTKIIAARASRALVDACLRSLNQFGIQKTNVRVYVDNPGGIAFWRRLGFVDRHELVVLTKSHDTAEG